MNRQCSTVEIVPNVAPQSVALAHDWLTGFRGGEWILEALCEMYPGSPLYTLIHVPGSTSSTIEAREIHASFLSGIPGVASSYRKLLPLFPLAASSLKVAEEVETMISTSHCVIKGVKKPQGAYHLSYIHSPMRYMYDQFEAYFGKASGASRSVRVAAHFVRPYLTGWDKASNKNVDLLVANSGFVRERIRRYYDRDSVVVHPFVEVPPEIVSGHSAKSDYFLMVTAFAPNKRVDLAIEAFNELKLPLKIVGGGQEGERLRSLAGKTVEFLGGVSRSEVLDLMQRARGFIFPGVEDFGITPLEALSCGTPLVAFKAGGVLETLNEADTEFFDTPSSQSLTAAVRRFIEREARSDFSIDKARLKAFSRAEFQRQIGELVSSREKR
ncbi:MAG: glycosyltransferase [Candidatus Vecturithrix sp.]|jgi:glycosyltransferase involved in cell wall biosynthesis|nr:glycosyltransferase [Candidatus Vecturithrix sp.]